MTDRVSSGMDLQAGQAASMRTVAALYGFRPAEELRAAGPDACVRKGSDLATVLRSILAHPAR